MRGMSGAGAQDRFPAVAGSWALSGDKAQAGIGRVDTLGGQAGGHPGWFRLVGSPALGIHTRLGRSIRSDMPEKLRITSEHNILSSLSRQLGGGQTGLSGPRVLRPLRPSKAA